MRNTLQIIFASAPKQIDFDNVLFILRIVCMVKNNVLQRDCIAD